MDTQEDMICSNTYEMTLRQTGPRAATRETKIASAKKRLESPLTIRIKAF